MLSWLPPELLQEEHFWVCLLLHPSVRLQDPAASAPLCPWSWWPWPTRLHAAAPGPRGQPQSHAAFLHGAWRAGQLAPRHVCVAQAPEPAAAPGDARGAYRPVKRTWQRYCPSASIEYIRTHNYIHPVIIFQLWFGALKWIAVTMNDERENTESLCVNRKKQVQPLHSILVSWLHSKNLLFMFIANQPHKCSETC